jgi:hypothetical protein
MDSQPDIDAFLARMRERRAKTFQDAADTSLLMHATQFVCMRFYFLLDIYCWLYVKTWFRRHANQTADIALKGMNKLYADAIDTYHFLWAIAAFLCYWIGWKIYTSHVRGDEWEYVLWAIPVTLCIYRIFECYAALIEMLFRDSDSRHHQFRILLHAFLHYLSVGFAFALFYLFTDRYFQTFSAENDDGRIETQFGEMFDPIYDSFLTVVAFSGNDTPSWWLGKLLVLIELMFGFMLATFIFLNITQVWVGEKKTIDL